MAAAEKKTRDEARAGVEPSVRVFTTWTPSLIRSAEIQADSGNLRLTASLCDWILSDERVGSTLQSRVDALLGLTPTFEAAGDKRRSNRAVKALEGQEDYWEAYPETELGLLLKWGAVMGLAPAQHKPEYRDGYGNRLLPKPEFWHPQHVRYDNQYRRWMTRVSQVGQLDSGTEVELVPGDSTWLLHTPYGKNRPWSLGLWRGLSRLILLKYLAIGDWARHSEKGALLAGTTPPDVETTKEQRQELAHDLYTRGREGVVVLPAGFDLKLIETVANTQAIYDAQIKMVNTAVAVSVRGGNLTTEVQGGSRAAAESQERLGDQGRLRFDAQSITTTIHDQSLVWWAEWNFGDRNLAPWPIYPVEPKKDLKRRADVANTAADAAKKFVDLGMKVDGEEFAQDFEIDGWLSGDPKAPPKPPAPTPPVPGEPPPKDGVPPAPPGEKLEAKGLARSPILRLASGAASSDNEGFIDGQVYADRLTAEATAAAEVALAPTLTAIAEELDAATDFEDLKVRLRSRFESLDETELVELAYKAMYVAELAGRASVNQDA